MKTLAGAPRHVYGANVIVYVIVTRHLPIIVQITMTRNTQSQETGFKDYSLKGCWGVTQTKMHHSGEQKWTKPIFRVTGAVFFKSVIFI